MQIKMRQENQDGIARLEASGDIQEILINEDIVHPDEESISVCYRGKNSSGIVDFTPSEIEQIYDAIKSRIHLIKGFKRLSGGGARLL
jgi:hypothetical protein